MHTIELRHIFISPEHAYVGQDPADASKQKMLAPGEVECVAAKGIRGDRYFAHQENYKGQITFFSGEVFEAACAHVGASDCPPWAMRRNVMIHGIDLNELVGATFEINGVRFVGTEECAPCRWMDRSIGDGAREFLKGRGGLRARILSSGLLRCGNAELHVLTA